MPAPRLLAECTLFDSERFRLARETWQTPDGVIERPVIHHPGAVAIIAQPVPGRLLLVRQFRYPIRRWTLEIPAGTRVPGESPEVTAHRELREEAGQTCMRLHELMRLFPAVGVSDEELIIYRAHGLAPCPAAPELGELVSPELIEVSDLSSHIAAGMICDAKTLLALSLLGITPTPQLLPAEGL